MHHRWLTHFPWSVALLLLMALLWSPVPLFAQEGTGDTGNAGLVIVDGSGEVQNYCVTVDDDATGWDLLVGAEVAVNSEPSAMGNTICAINGVGCSSPRESCFCQCQGSPCVYWSFWMQNENGDWVYSNQGASNAKVRAGEVQAWVWGDGTTGNAPEPPRVAFADICHAPVPSEAVTSETVPSATVISDTVTSADMAENASDATDTPIAEALTTGTPSAGTQETTFPWTLLLVLAPLPLILLVLLRKR